MHALRLPRKMKTQRENGEPKAAGTLPTQEAEWVGGGANLRVDLSELLVFCAFVGNDGIKKEQIRPRSFVSLNCLRGRGDGEWRGRGAFLNPHDVNHHRGNVSGRERGPRTSPQCSDLQRRKKGSVSAALKERVKYGPVCIGTPREGYCDKRRRDSGRGGCMSVCPSPEH